MRIQTTPSARLDYIIEFGTPEVASLATLLDGILAYGEPLHVTQDF